MAVTGNTATQEFEILTKLGIISDHQVDDRTVSLYTQYKLFGMDRNFTTHASDPGSYQIGARGVAINVIIGVVDTALAEHPRIKELVNLARCAGTLTPVKYVQKAFESDLLITKYSLTCIYQGVTFEVRITNRGKLADSRTNHQQLCYAVMMNLIQGRDTFSDKGVTKVSLKEGGPTGFPKSHIVGVGTKIVIAREAEIFTSFISQHASETKAALSVMGKIDKLPRFWTPAQKLDVLGKLGIISDVVWEHTDHNQSVHYKDVNGVKRRHSLLQSPKQTYNGLRRVIECEVFNLSAETLTNNEYKAVQNLLPLIYEGKLKPFTFRLWHDKKVKAFTFECQDVIFEIQSTGLAGRSNRQTCYDAALKIAQLPPLPLSDKKVSKIILQEREESMSGAGSAMMILTKIVAYRGEGILFSNSYAGTAEDVNVISQISVAIEMSPPPGMKKVNVVAPASPNPLDLLVRLGIIPKYTQTVEGKNLHYEYNIFGQDYKCDMTRLHDETESQFFIRAAKAIQQRIIHLHHVDTASCLQRLLVLIPEDKMPVLSFKDTFDPSQGYKLTERTLTFAYNQFDFVVHFNSKTNSCRSLKYDTYLVVQNVSQMTTYFPSSSNERIMIILTEQKGDGETKIEVRRNGVCEKVISPNVAARHSTCEVLVKLLRTMIETSTPSSPAASSTPSAPVQSASVTFQKTIDILTKLGVISSFLIDPRTYCATYIQFGKTVKYEPKFANEADAYASIITKIRDDAPEYMKGNICRLMEFVVLGQLKPSASSETPDGGADLFFSANGVNFILKSVPYSRRSDHGCRRAVYEAAIALIEDVVKPINIKVIHVNLTEYLVYNAVHTKVEIKGDNITMILHSPYLISDPETMNTLSKQFKSSSSAAPAASSAIQIKLEAAPVTPNPHIFFHVDTSKDLAEGIYRIISPLTSEHVPVRGNNGKVWWLHGPTVDTELVIKLLTGSSHPWIQLAYEFGQLPKEGQNFMLVGHSYNDSEDTMAQIVYQKAYESMKK